MQFVTCCAAAVVRTFAETNMVADWLTPEQMVSAANKAGWAEAEFVDLTPDIRLSFELMGRKVCECAEMAFGSGDGT